jgi:hypothetical protein
MDRAQAGFRPLRNPDSAFLDVASRMWRFCDEPNDLALFRLLGDGESGRSRYEVTVCRFALLASLLVIGCATKGDQLTPAETALEKKDQRGWSSEEGRIR